MMQSICFDTVNGFVLVREPSTPELCSAPAIEDSFYSIASGNVRESLSGLGSQQGILQLDNEIEARLGNLQHDASKIVSKSMRWATKGIPKIAKKTACFADYYFFSKCTDRGMNQIDCIVV